MTINAKQAANLLGVTPKTYKDWQDRLGAPGSLDPEGKRYVVDVKDLIDWEVKRQVAKGLEAAKELAKEELREDANEEGDFLDPIQEKAKLDKARREAQERQNAVAAGELISLHDVMESDSLIVSFIKNMLLALGARTAKSVTSDKGEQRVLKAKIDEEANKTLEELVRHFTHSDAPSEEAV